MNGMSGIRHLPAAARIARPWKNGGGITYDIATYPEGADLDTFAWRISMAEVAKDGPFSSFPGIDRSMIILAGEGLWLQLGKAPETGLRLGDEALAFPADIPTQSRLMASEVLDFNVMSRRSRFRHRVRRLTLSGEHHLDWSGPIALLWCAGQGRIKTEAGMIAPARLDAFLAPTPCQWHIEARGEASILQVEFFEMP